MASKPSTPPTTRPPAKLTIPANADPRAAAWLLRLLRHGERATSNANGK